MYKGLQSKHETLEELELFHGSLIYSRDGESWLSTLNSNSADAKQKQIAKWLVLYN